MSMQIASTELFVSPRRSINSRTKICFSERNIMNTQINFYRRGLPTLLAIAAFTGATILPAFAATKMTCDLPGCPLTVPVISNAKQTIAPMRDYPVTIGKRTVMASTLTPRTQAPVASSATQRANRDYLVLVGKRTVMASQVKQEPTPLPSPIRCPAGQFVTTGKTTYYATTCSLKGTTKALPCCG